MVRQRARIRYCKQGDLRLIGHQDLMRVWERLFRRAGIGLRMSEGFHPRPKMSLPGALPLGVVGLDELVEVEFESGSEASPSQPTDLQALLAPQCPEGLVVNSIEFVPADAPSAQLSHIELELPLPPERVSAVARRIDELLAQATIPVERGEERRAFDLRPHIESLTVADDTLRVRLRVGNEGSVRPRELLSVLELADLETQGVCWTRTSVEVVP